MITLGVSKTSGGFQPRQMLNPSGGDLLNYNLYRDASRTQVWGNGSQGTYVVIDVIGKNRTKTFPIYGRTPGGQDVRTGNYADGLVVTVQY